MPVRQLVFDMDGTLLDSSVAVPAAYQAAVRRLGGPELSPEQVVAGYARGPSDVLLAHLLGRDLSAGESEVYYDELAGVTVRPYPGVAAALTRLRAAGQPIAVFTGASRRAATMLLTGAGITVDVLVGGDEIARPKPAGDGLLLTADRLGLPAPELAYIGDAPNDLLAARAVRALSAAAAWGHQYQRDAAADVTLSEPAEALKLLADGAHSGEV